jgi:hypothetical protein
MTEVTPAYDWLDRYQRAWKTDDAADIARLFTRDAVYLRAPYADPIVGLEAITDWWIAEVEPGIADFTAHVVMESIDTAVIEGRTAYSDDVVYLNMWIVHLEPDGRASAFTEWWMVEGEIAYDGEDT